jgi:hypothetical protein
MSDNYRTQKICFLISACFVGVVAILETAVAVHLIRYPPRDPTLLGSSSLSPTTSQALGITK